MGQSWCNGDCEWNADTNSCEAKQQGNDVSDQLGDQPEQGDDVSGGNQTACTVDDSQCGYLSWKNDGICDDDNNNCECEWDGGDCCGDNVNIEWCDDCECLDPNFCNVDDSQCGNPYWKNDGICDDDNNNCHCEWDGGDCCGDNVNTSWCDDCECLDPSSVH